MKHSNSVMSILKRTRNVRVRTITENLEIAGNLNNQNVMFYQLFYRDCN